MVTNKREAGNTTMSSNWLIKTLDGYFTETLYWSNVDGYVDRDSATRFTTDERHALRLPLEGEWQEEKQ